MKQVCPGWTAQDWGKMQLNITSLWITCLNFLAMRNLTAAADDTGSKPLTERHSLTSDMNCAVAASSDGESPNADAVDISPGCGLVPQSSFLSLFHLLVDERFKVHTTTSSFSRQMFSVGRQAVHLMRIWFELGRATNSQDGSEDAWVSEFLTKLNRLFILSWWHMCDTLRKVNRNSQLWTCYSCRRAKSMFRRRRQNVIYPKHKVFKEQFTKLKNEHPHSSPINEFTDVTQSIHIISSTWSTLTVKTCHQSHHFRCYLAMFEHILHFEGQADSPTS